MPRAVSPQRGSEPQNLHYNAQNGSPHKARLKIIGRELPDIESDEQFQANWKITRAKEEALLLEFHSQLSSAGLLRPEHDKYYLRRFLRARQHDLIRAKQMFSDHVKWRKEENVDDIVHKFKFHERDVFLSLYPQGYHKTDKLGRPVYIQHLGAINIKKLNEITNEDRMLKFHIQEYERCMHYIMPACSKVAGRHVEQTFAIIDVTGVGLSHLSGQVKNLLSKITSIDQNNYPEMMGKTVIINAPNMFKMVWGMVKRFLDPRTLTKIELHGSNYQQVLLKYISGENLPEYLGGSSKATLLDDAGPWQDKDLIAEIDADYKAAVEGLFVEADATTTPAEAASLSAELRTSGEASTTGQAVEEPPRGTSPKRKLSIRPFRRQQITAATSGPTAAEAAAEADVFHDSLELQSRSASYASEDDATYYSPRSTSSFSSYGEKVRETGEGTPHPLLESMEAPKAQTAGHSRQLRRREQESLAVQLTLAARVRRLEDAVPGLKEKLAPNLDLQLEHGSFTRSGGHNVLGRVETLESVIEVLLTIQEEQLQPVVADSHAEETERSPCSTCCTIM